jgi:HPt (histidine-containing phosphotransfer) domain-containing protein
LFGTLERFHKPAAATPSQRGADLSPPQPSSIETPGTGSPPSPTGERKRTEVRAPEADGLPAAEGLDTKDGLTRVAGNRKLYLKLLRQFIEQQGTSVGQISEALTAGDRALAERLAHTLKGVAGNIGAKPVAAAAGALEKLIREAATATEVEVALKQVSATLDPLIEQLGTALPSPAPAATPSATPPADPAQTRAAAATLTKLLAQFDVGAVEFVEANKAALQTLFAGDAWPQFEKLVQGYAFADAQAQLEQALNTFPGK